MEEKK
jgi:hypothetical protein